MVNGYFQGCVYTLNCILFMYSINYHLSSVISKCDRQKDVFFVLDENNVIGFCLALLLVIIIKYLNAMTGEFQTTLACVSEGVPKKLKIKRNASEIWFLVKLGKII